MLDAKDVLAPFRELLEKSQGNVLLGLRLVERIERFPGPTAEEEDLIDRVSLMGPAVDMAQGKRDFKAWILRNGLEEVHASVRITLDRLFVYKKIEQAIKANPSQDISRLQEDLKAQIIKLGLPEILDDVNSMLTTPLTLTDHVRTLNNARNCLVHSHGAVVRRFCNNAAKDRLSLKLRKLTLFYFKNGHRTVIDRKDQPGVENASINAGAGDYEIEFPISAQVDLSLQQFIDVLMTCFFLGAEIETRLNVPAPIFQLKMRIYYQILKGKS
jgi:hypothetical protein